MEVLLLVLGIMGALALILMPLTEWLKRPRLELEPNSWGGSHPEWTFAVVHVRNKPLPGWLLPVIGRESANGCTVTAEFFLQGQKLPAIRIVEARWSGTPEPIRVRSIDDATSPTGKSIVLEYDPSKVEPSRSFDVAPSSLGQEVAVAVLRDDSRAFGFSAYSYESERFGVKDLELLSKGVYEVEVTANAGGLRKSARFLLNFQSGDFGQFQLTKR